jgi:hypothetical protein
MKKLILTVVFGCLLTTLVFAQQKSKPDTAKAESAEELAKKLSNPVASLVSVPFQNNTDWGIGPNNGSKNTLNFQPVVPVSLNPNLNLIVRVILPIIAQRDIIGPNTSQTGLSDITATAFFAPTHIKNGLIWGVGPAILIPTGTSKYLGTQKFGIGPSALILKQAGALTYGMLFNQIWSVVGASDRSPVNQLFLQPFFTHNWKSGAGLGVNAELTENWHTSSFTGFVNPLVSGVTKLGKQTVQLGLGPRIPIAGPEGSKPDFGIRGVFTLVFPK